MYTHIHTLSASATEWCGAAKISDLAYYIDKDERESLAGERAGLLMAHNGSLQDKTRKWVHYEIYYYCHNVLTFPSTVTGQFLQYTFGAS